MPKIDDAAEIRALAYQIWEREGCPTGREHEHWAQANRVYRELHPVSDLMKINRVPDSEMSLPTYSEVDRLREALWTPEPFSRELFANEVPEDLATWRRRRGRIDPVTAGTVVASRVEGRRA